MNIEPVILVTGAARRVGAAIARRLHRRGARIAIHHRHSASEAAALADELNGLRPGSAAVLQADLTVAGSAASLVAETIRAFGRLDGLVNNASSFFPTPMGAIDGNSWEDLTGSNLKAPLFLSQAAAPHLRQEAGAIVNIIDIHADRPLKGYAVYTAAKAGLAGLTRALALELAPQVRVNGIAPGAIQWPEQGDDFPAAERARILEQIPLARIGAPEDIARTAEFLIFDAPYITGQILAVDGGRNLVL